MDEFDKMMAEMHEAFAETLTELKKLHHFDPAVLNAFKEDVAELINIKHIYANKRSQLRSKAEKEIVRLEYSKGGETIHRGYFCPSPVFDLIVGGAKRGRLYKRKPAPGKYTYEYGFDKDDKLIRCKGLNEEYLIYNEAMDIVYGVGFHNTGEINEVSKCSYDNGNMIRYERSLCWLEEFADLHHEEYIYENNRLTEVTMFYNVQPSMGFYSECRYLVEQIEGGKITRLTGGEVVNGEWQQDVYEFN